MTDKQIIVDGVDVKGCKRRIGKDNYCRYYKRLCSENNYNCIWKKYLRKKQECKELREEIKTNGFGCFNIEMAEQLDQLKVENEELKKTLTEIKKIAERGFQHSQCNCGAKADLDLILQKICGAINE